MTTRTDDNTRLTDAWLAKVLMPNRKFRDYYGDSDFGRLTIRMFTGEPAHVIFNRVFLRIARTRGDVRLIARALNVPLVSDAGAMP